MDQLCGGDFLEEYVLSGYHSTLRLKLGRGTGIEKQPPAANMVLPAALFWAEGSQQHILGENSIDCSPINFSLMTFKMKAD